MASYKHISTIDLKVYPTELLAKDDEVYILKSKVLWQLKEDNKLNKILELDHGLVYNAHVLGNNKLVIGKMYHNDNIIYDVSSDKKVNLPSDIESVDFANEIYLYFKKHKCTGERYIYDIKKQEIIGKFDQHKTLHAKGCTIYNGEIYFTDYWNPITYVYSLNGELTKQIKYDIDDWNRCKFYIYNNNLYIYTVNGKLYTYDLDGCLLETRDINEQNVTSFAITKTKLYFLIQYKILKIYELINSSQLNE